ncbi:MAG: hypothetical protein KatS3mg108_1002 [Isosphaeraceae bacterium]|nr:MAG: hypothetical protein KatS3mg108_1002 [Isosphaeraceae bacterium]
MLSETAPAVGGRFKYTGREYDAATGLYDYRNRWYDPKAGVFVEQDPLGFAAGDANLSRYVGNAPTIYADPMGLAYEENDEVDPERRMRRVDGSKARMNPRGWERTGGRRTAAWATTWR